MLGAGSPVNYYMPAVNTLALSQTLGCFLFFLLFKNIYRRQIFVPDIMSENKQHLSGNTPNSDHITCWSFVGRAGKTTQFLPFGSIFPNPLHTTCLLSTSQAFSSWETACTVSRQVLLGAYPHRRKPSQILQQGRNQNPQQVPPWALVSCLLRMSL